MHTNFCVILHFVNNCVYTHINIPESNVEMGGVQSPDGVALSDDDEAVGSEDGAGQSGDRPSQTVEGLFGDAADLSSS